MGVLERDGERRPLVVETVSDATVKKVRARVRFAYQPPDGLTWEQEMLTKSAAEGLKEQAESG